MARRHLHRREPAYQRLDGRDALPDPVAEPFANPLPKTNQKKDPKPVPAPAQTVVSVVYVTAAKTFSGPIAGYTTIAIGAPLVASSQPATIRPTMLPTDIRYSGPASEESTTSSTTTSEESTTTTTTRSTSSSTTLSTITTTTTSSSASVDAAAASGTGTGTGTGVSKSSPSTVGLSGAAKAGIALAVLVGIGLLLAVILLFFRRKRRANDSYNKASDEGSSFAHNDVAPVAVDRDSMRSTDNAGIVPQLSLRPVTQFRPNFDPNRKSAGNPLAATKAGGAASRGSLASTAGPSPLSGIALERKTTPSPTNDPANPFGNHAEPSERAIGTGSGTGSQVDASAFPAPSNGMATGAPPATGFAAAAAAAAGAGLVAGAASGRQNPPPPLDLNNGRKFSTDTSASQISLPLSDTGSDNSRVSAMTPSTPTVPAAAAAVATTAVTGTASPTSSPVHRVQLDFKPSMADELGLRAGQLVRLLHEYDDGWALCIRLDRSQQGVCPRTCLSKQPVKPRPNSPRSGQPPTMRAAAHGRPPMAPQVQPHRPSSPAGSFHSQSSYVGLQARPVNPYAGQARPQSPSPPRPQSPALSRPRSPAPSRPQTPVEQRSRANSVGQARESAGPGPSKMNPNGVLNAERPPQRLPTVLRSGSPGPRPIQQAAAVPARKPLPEHEVGHAI
ncbi:MAG: hypothetical protein M1840_007778 [Geoglossum simile]|nr:MAG: hypothetical protein M1840_007778 [Geoglossum simile]